MLLNGYILKLKFFRFNKGINQVSENKDGYNKQCNNHSIQILSKKLMDLKKSQKQAKPAR
jgi:hypothetical protein